MIELRDIPGYEGYYQVSDDGQVKSIERKAGVRGGGFRTVPERILKQCVSSNGYRQVNLHADGVMTSLLVHRLVMLAFVGECPLGYEVCHNNGNSADCRLTNLRYDTRRGNAADRRRHGTERNQHAGKTHCQHGHEFTPENTYYYLARGIACRGCIACRQEKGRQHYLRRKSAA
jgi:hypothetical protein